MIQSSTEIIWLTEIIWFKQKHKFIVSCHRWAERPRWALCLPQSNKGLTGPTHLTLSSVSRRVWTTFRRIHSPFHWAKHFLRPFRNFAEIFCTSAHPQPFCEFHIHKITTTKQLAWVMSMLCQRPGVSSKDSAELSDICTCLWVDMSGYFVPYFCSRKRNLRFYLTASYNPASVRYNTVFFSLASQISGARAKRLSTC